MLFPVLRWTCSSASASSSSSSSSSHLDPAAERERAPSLLAERPLESSQRERRGPREQNPPRHLRARERQTRVPRDDDVLHRDRPRAPRRVLLLLLLLLLLR
eukprot:31190-Pelagococcus_subviridis.AAC.5